LINFSCCIPDMFSLEIVGDDVRFALAAPEVAPDLAHQLRLIARALPSKGIAFDVLIELFVRIDLRTIAGEKKYPNPLFVFFYPVFHLMGTVDRVAVDNEIYPAITLTE